MNRISKPGLAISAFAVAFVCAAIAFYVGAYLTNASPSAGAVQTPQGAHLYLATVPAAELSDPHPDWVSYYHISSTDTNWNHATTYILPANTEVTVTIFEFDTQTGLRNNFLGAVEGTQGGTETLNGKTVSYINPNTASHIFAIPKIGLVVPLAGPAGTTGTLCANAPCPLSDDHNTITFKFHTPAKGLYRFQCFVPCAAGYIDGIGGPMQRVGYMDGYIKV
ncbi:MAG: hypothetical protein ACRDL5_06640, partial [Solirubrobacteraceae bacterium]